ncbi:MAG TPA: transposase [Blastocatellia bacterium]|nr:transposase [Blastocatellia bacterium]
MLTLPAELLSLIVVFAPLFAKPVFEHVQWLVLGAILAPGKRTVTACLRAVGLGHQQHFQNYHRVLNRDRWNPLLAARILLGLIVALLPANSAIVVGADDTLERRRGKKINGLGCYRDAVRSTRKHVVKCFGLKWLSLMVMVKLPFSSRVWALPFLTLLCRAADKGAKGEPKSVIDILMMAARLVSRWLPDRAIVLVADGAFAAVKLALLCAGTPNLILVTRLRLDASLYHPAGVQPKGKRGRKPLKGARQRKLQEWAARSDTPWEAMEVAWYGGVRKPVLVFSRTGLWHRPGWPPVAIRYVLVRDPDGKLRDAAMACTQLDASAAQIIEWFVMRWSVEVTFEESRAHLGMESGRQWSDLAIARTTPVVLGLFSLVTMLALRLATDGKVPVNETAWYSKAEASFSDCLIFVRKHCWALEIFVNSAQSAESVLIPSKVLNHLVSCLAVAA